MLGVAIAGGGLSGLALARNLLARQISFGVFEARPRLGGRVLSVSGTDSHALSVPCADGPAPSARGADNRVRFDLGPTWYWPQSQPGLTQLISELGLENFAQHDEGTVLSLEDPDKPAASAQIEGVHGGARRLAGGMASLIEALAARVRSSRVHLEHVLRKVRLRQDRVELHFEHRGAPCVIEAAHVVLAMPPRLIAERVQFEPPLTEEVRAALVATPTWMAAQAKAVIRYESAVWRAAGQSGNAFVRHEQATLNEIFDACDAKGDVAALGAFVALSPSRRRDFRFGLPMLMSNQMAQLFGSGLQEVEQLFHDWADEPCTCSSRDRDELDASTGSPATVDASALRAAHWGGRLHFAGSETATAAAGYLEGALDAARRVERLLSAVSAASGATDSPVTRMPHAAGDDADTPVNSTSLAHFTRWVRAQQDIAFDSYRQHINASLAGQQRDQLTQRAVLHSVERVFDAALAYLETLPFDMKSVSVQRGRSALTPGVQAAFHGFIDRLLEDVTRFNRTSCALSNFPDEHHIPKDYEQALLRDIAAAWSEFSVSANGILLGKMIKVPPMPSPMSFAPGAASP